VPRDCIFCEIVAGRAPAHRVHEDERTLAFLDIVPAAPGHTLVIPKAHGENVHDTSADDLAAVIRVSQRVAAAQHSVLEPDGLAVFQLNGEAAGQSVFHYHMHLVPRRHGDPAGLHGRGPGEPAELARTAEALAAAVAAG